MKSPKLPTGKGLNSSAGFHSASWQQACYELEQKGETYILVTVIGIAGSTPRESGCKMVITGEDIYATLGGGHLEFVVIQKAREILLSVADRETETPSLPLLEYFPLAASLGQCCGGSATVLFELIEPAAMLLDIYGAGHVAHSLVNIIKDLPIKVRWIDSREALFPDLSQTSSIQVANNVDFVVDSEPETCVATAQTGSAFLVLTHNHQLDFAITEAVLRRQQMDNDVQWLGVIGSETKAVRFKKRLSAKGFTQAAIESMNSPVGLPDVNGKLPMEVAVSIAAQLMGLYQQHKTYQHSHKKREGVQWKTLQNELVKT